MKNRGKGKFYSERGQTLNEAVIAVSLLTLGVIGMLGGIVRSFSQAGILADRVTATFLAAEGVEIAKNIVDGTSMRSSKAGTDLYGSNWRNDFPNEKKYYQLDFYATASGSPAVVNPEAGLSDSEKVSLVPLKFDAATSIFSYSGGKDTSFRRLVGVPVSSGNRMKIRSYVYWLAKNGGWYSVSTETDLLNWR